MKYFVIILFLIFVQKATAQESANFIVEGKVKKTISFNLSDLKGYKTVALDSMTIYNHLLQRKGSIKNIKGVLLKDILSKVDIVSNSPKTLSEYYLICSATDNYKVVYSWNEIFNSPSGDQIIIMTSYDSDPLKKQSGTIAMITPSDKATGRRFVKGLNKITILQVN